MDKDTSKRAKIDPLENLIEDFELMDDIPTLTNLANDKQSLHDYDKNCTCINCCAHRVIEATSQKNRSPRISHPKSQPATKPTNKTQPKKVYGDGIKMDNVTFTSAWEDWEIE